MNGTSDDQYWSVDIPGLTEQQAHELVEWVESHNAGWFGKATTLSPHDSLTMHLDRESAQVLLDALESKFEAADPGRGLAEAIADWLEWSSGAQASSPNAGPAPPPPPL